MYNETNAIENLTVKELRVLTMRLANTVIESVKEDYKMNRLYERETDFVAGFFTTIVKNFWAKEFIVPHCEQLDGVNIGKVYEHFLPNFFTEKEIREYIDFQINFFLDEFGSTNEKFLMAELFGIEDEKDAPTLFRFIVEELLNENISDKKDTIIDLRK